MSKDKKKGATLRTLYYFWRASWEGKAKWLTLGILVVAPIGLFFGNIIVPIGVSEIIGKLASGDFEFSGYVPLIWMTVGAAAIHAIVLVRIQDFLDWSLDAVGGFWLQKMAFEAIVNQTMTFHGNRFSGSLTSQANKLSSAYIRLKSDLSWSLYPLILVVVMSVITMWTVLPVYGAIMAGFSVLYVAVSIFTYRKTSGAEEGLAAAENKQTGQLADVITNIQSVKSYSREGHERKRFSNVARATYKATFRLRNVSGLRNLSLNAINMVAFAVLLVMVIQAPERFGIGVAGVVLLYQLTNQILDWIWTISGVLRNFNRSFGDAKEIVEVLDAPVEVVDKTKRELELAATTVEFIGVTFKHDGAKDSILENFSLSIGAGERVGLVGISGAGKTTVTKLLLRFADVDEGAILVGGEDIRKVTQASLREKVAYVSQETSLFHRSIFENIAYGQPDASLKEVQAAARKANASGFIEELPNGYDTLVGERGVKLSGGQRQRVAIARAILKNAPILVLDEATSALDSESEAAIQEALVELMKGRTALVIAHRLSTVASLDRIIVLRDGVIIEDGPHEKLVASDKEYAKMWKRQIKQK